MKHFFEYADQNFGINHVYDKNPSTENFQMHTHDTTEIFYFIKGKGIYHIEGSEYILEAGDIIIMRTSESHYIEIDTKHPYERIVINFYTDFFEKIDSDNLLLKAVLERKSGKLNQYKSYDFRNESYKQYLENMISDDGNPRINIITNLMPLLNEIYLAYISRQTEENSLDTTEYRIIRYINKNLSADINLDTICSKYYVSKPQLCRIFKKSTGTTVWQYITIKRLIMAKQLILSGKNPTHIFADCGFNDYSTFYRAYVKNFGHSPKEEM